MNRQSLRPYAVALGIVALIGALTYIILPERSESPSIETTGKARPTNAALQSVEKGIIGTWKSDDDAAYTVSYSQDGVVVETYDYTTSNPPEAPFSVTGTWQVMSDNAVLTLVTQNDEEVFVYEITAFDERSMTLRKEGSVSDLSFTRTR